MKKYFLILVCLAATLCASAQTTGSLYPQNKSVYVPETYNNIMEVSYDNLIQDLYSSLDIYDINGNLVGQKSISDLPSGLYIVNGKKFIVR